MTLAGRLATKLAANGLLQTNDATDALADGARAQADDVEPRRLLRAAVRAPGRRAAGLAGDRSSCRRHAAAGSLYDRVQVR